MKHPVCSLVGDVLKNVSIVSVVKTSDADDERSVPSRSLLVVRCTLKSELLGHAFTAVY